MGYKDLQARDVSGNFWMVSLDTSLWVYWFRYLRVLIVLRREVICCKFLREKSTQWFDFYKQDYYYIRCCYIYPSRELLYLFNFGCRAYSKFLGSIITEFWPSDYVFWCSMDTFLRSWGRICLLAIITFFENLILLVKLTVWMFL